MPTSNSAASDHAANDGQHSTLDRHYQELADQVDYINDPDLQAEVFEFLETLSEVPTVDPVTHVDHELDSVQTIEEDYTTSDGEERTAGNQYPMRRASSNGDEDFPDDCEGCPHYGVRCPMATDPDIQRRRELIRDDATDQPTEHTMAALRTLANQTNCHVLRNALTEYHEKTTGLEARGWELRRRVTVELQPTDDSARVASELAGDGA